MPHFVNIATNGKKPLLIDADSISVVKEVDAKKKGETTLSFSSNEEHGFLYIDKEFWNVDTDNCIRQLSNAGEELFAFPYIWGDGETPGGKTMGRFFVNPAAFNYIITSEPSIEEGDTEETVAMLLGVDGYGLVESYGVPVKTVEKFMDLVKAQKPDLVRINPDEATARFYKPGYVIYDPQKIIRIYPNSYDLDIRFANGGLIDFNFPDRHFGQEYLDRKINGLSGEKRNSLSRDDMTRIFMVAQKYKDGMGSRIRREFARRASRNVPGLVKIENAKSPFYTRFNNVSWIKQNEKVLSFTFKKGSPDDTVGYGENVYFDSEETATEELARLQGLINGAKDEAGPTIEKPQSPGPA